MGTWGYRIFQNEDVLLGMEWDFTSIWKTGDDGWPTLRF